MNLHTLTIISVLVFINVFISVLFAFTKSHARISKWSVLIVLFVFVLILSWYMKDFTAQWVLIEACTLFGSLLISMSNNEKSTMVAWKFLLLNSFGMGIAFLGFIILSYSAHAVASMNIAITMQNIQASKSTLVDVGLWFVVFGYSVKLGLFPNQYWVSDTYSESPSQISALFASLIPVSLAIALRPVIQMDSLITTEHFNSRNALLVMGIATMIYSILTLYQVRDIRRITALIALFHNGAIGVFLWLNTGDEIFYLALTSLVVIKSLIFSAMGVLRLDLPSRIIDEINPKDGLHPISKFIYIASIFMAFAVPISPMFLSDMMAMRMAVKHSYYWYILVPC
jgi:hydrogenase-4 component F